MRFLTRHLPIVDQKVSTLGPSIEDIITRHVLLYSSSPHYIHLKEWGTGRAGGLAPPLPKKQEFKFLTKFTHQTTTDQHTVLLPFASSTLALSSTLNESTIDGL
ncbi:unnamed protein product [Cuscuta epithymum]|uniref:Uncharacterized protein n=1 Tax=Cuscuta epithymum TaxID=186058 RepID=A0AAV0C6G2_9ASTE|nr:unnamed protein product [Cuscuta epithymum]